MSSAWGGVPKAEGVPELRTEPGREVGTKGLGVNWLGSVTFTTVQPGTSHKAQGSWMSRLESAGKSGSLLVCPFRALCADR